MSGCHPDATTKKIAGERETSEQKEGNPRNTAGKRTKKRRDVDVRNANEMRTVEEANKRLMNEAETRCRIKSGVTAKKENPHTIRG